MAKLPKPRFNLRSPKAQTETLIMLVFRYRGKRVLYSTNLSILPSDWDFKAHRPLQKERRPDLWSIRRQLDDIDSYCRSIYIEYRYGCISVADFKKCLDEKTGKSEMKILKPKPTFLEFLDEELEEMKTQGMRRSSYGPYKLHADIIKKFAKQTGKFDYDDVDWNLRLQMIDWLSSRNIQVGYGNKTLSILRQFMERARRKEYHTNVKYQGLGWLVTHKKAASTPVTLTPEELKLLAEMQLPRHLKKIRDLFLIGAGTGQRYSDYCRYCPDHFYKTINEAPILSIIAQKTGIPAKIPLNIFPWLIPILEDNEYTAPKISLQKYNQSLKELSKKAGFEERVLVVRQHMGRKPRIEKEFAPKYELISSHTCRRSFATNLYRMGFSLSQIMLMTGHSTETQLRTYIGIDAEENAEKISLQIQERSHSLTQIHSS